MVIASVDQSLWQCACVLTIVNSILQKMSRGIQSGTYAGTIAYGVNSTYIRAIKDKGKAPALFSC